MKVKIKQNIWGNWYGYVGGRKVEMFFGHPYLQQMDAETWLNRMQMNPHLADEAYQEHKRASAVGLSAAKGGHRGSGDH